MRALECPACKEPMIVAEYGDVEIDTCVACGGVWLDGGELEALLGSPVPELAEPDAGLGEPVRDCPVCVDKLVKDRYGHSDVVVDKCPHGDGIWLDRGELEAILAACREPPADAGTDQQAAAALAGFFGGTPPCPCDDPTDPTGESP